MEKQFKNCDTLCENLHQTLVNLDNGKISHNSANAKARIGFAIIKAKADQLKYQQYLGIVEKNDFYEH